MSMSTDHILKLAEIIREVDGGNRLGAAALAEAILSHPGNRRSPAIEPEEPTDEELRQLWRELYAFHDGPTSGDVVEIARAVLSRWGLPAAEPEGTITEPRGCPTPGACSCPTAPFAPPELIRALELAEAALADIGDAERESGDDLAWAEARAAQDLPRIRAVLARWGSQPSTVAHS
jgi:hypothetical protein